MTERVAAHDQAVTHHYTVHYPPHFPRETDPHYRDFNAYHRKHHDTAKCSIGEHRSDYTECDLTHPMELHHSHIEFALLNGISFERLEHAFPGISDPAQVGAWIESDANLILLCAKHHRALGHGVHHLSSSDYEGSHFVEGVFEDPEPK